MSAFGLIAEPVVDWGSVLEVLYTSVIAGTGVTAAFAVAIHGAVRSVDSRRRGSMAGAGGYAVLMGLALAVVVGALVFGIVVMTSKG